MSAENENGNSATSELEQTLKLEQTRIQIKLGKLDLKKKRREERNAARAAELELRTKSANAEKSELEVETLRLAFLQSQLADGENREYMFCEGVTWDTVKIAIQKLNELSRRFANMPLTVTLNSPGGNVIAGLALYDHIRDLSGRGHHMTVKVRGMAASMGGILLQSGDTRIVGPEAMVLIHEVASGAWGKVSEQQESIDFSRTLWCKIAAILARRSSMSAEEIMRKAYKFDWWLSAEEAVELGFADEIN